MKIVRCAMVLVPLFGALGAERVRASNAGADSPGPAPTAVTPLPSGYTTYIYEAGWNMIGAPAGTTFAGAVAVYAYVSGAYVATDNRILGCQGSWAYFASPTAVSFDINGPNGPGYTSQCSLQAGWNLVSDPFYWRALLPPGVSGYWWNPEKQAYIAVDSMEMGQSIWMYSPADTIITLTTG